MRWKSQAMSTQYQRRLSERSPGEYMSTNYGGKEMQKRWDFTFLRRKEVERWEIQESEVGEEGVEWWAEDNTNIYSFLTGKYKWNSQAYYE